MDSTGSTPTLVLEGVRKTFGDGTQAQQEVLHHIDLRIQAGEFAALIGPSGSGKSTLLNLIGLLDRPTSGRIFIEGVETSTRDDEELTALRGRRLGFIFQYHHLLPEFTALENVTMPMLATGGVSSAMMRARGLEMLEAVGLLAWADHRANNLSGGQQQRVAIARALSMRPAMVLADEPSGNLDTKSADGVFDLMRKVNVAEGTTFLIVTHDPRLAARCDRIIELVDGSIISDRSNQPAHPA